MVSRGSNAIMESWGMALPVCGLKNNTWMDALCVFVCVSV